MGSNFWDGVKKDGETLTPDEKIKFGEALCTYLAASPEFAKIFFNTQVYNQIVNGVTTRGAHSAGVATVAAELARQKTLADGNEVDLSEEEVRIEAEISSLIAQALGDMHDLGHTPFGHDGEGALDDEMSRFDTNDAYDKSRKELYGEEYAKNSESKKMCYEHNETSSTISLALLRDFAHQKGYEIDDETMQYVATGVLAHSTSRVKDEPAGIEQKAVRLADKVAYIPQDLADLVKQGVLKASELTDGELSLLGLDRTRDSDVIRLLDSTDPEIRGLAIAQLDEGVKDVQIDLAQHCLVQGDGEMILDGGKDMIDLFDRTAKIVNAKDYDKEFAKAKKEYEETHTGEYKITQVELDAAKYIKAINEAKKMPMTTREEVAKRKEALDRATSEYEGFLSKPETRAAYLKITLRDAESLRVEKENEDDKVVSVETRDKKVAEAESKCKGFFPDYPNISKNPDELEGETLGPGLDPKLASLWVTKSKYQDAFIKGDLLRVSGDDEEHLEGESLSQINDRNGNGWMMKTTFQYFYSHIDQIPDDFKAKYAGTYTPQQLASAYIASFTNKGLETLYKGLVESKQVVAREDAIEALKKLGIENIEEFVDSDTPIKRNDGSKVSGNDILEGVYEQVTGQSIVAGKAKGMDEVEFAGIKGTSIPDVKLPEAVVEKVIQEQQQEAGISESETTIQPEQATADNAKQADTDKGKKEQVLLQVGISSKENVNSENISTVVKGIVRQAEEISRNEQYTHIAGETGKTVEEVKAEYEGKKEGAGVEI